MAATDFTVADVLAWARTKPAGERYNFLDAGMCAVAQFGRDTGRDYLVNLGHIGHYSEPLRLAVLADADMSEWTFGALVKRLEALCPETPVTKSDWLAIDTYLNADCGKVEA